MVQDLNNPSQNQANLKYNTSRQLHITFHNPNTTEETAKYLAKAIAKNLLDQATIRKQAIEDNEKRQSQSIAVSFASNRERTKSDESSSILQSIYE